MRIATASGSRPATPITSNRCPRTTRMGNRDMTETMICRSEGVCALVLGASHCDGSFAPPKCYGLSQKIRALFPVRFLYEKNQLFLVCPVHGAAGMGQRRRGARRLREGKARQRGAQRLFFSVIQDRQGAGALMHLRPLHAGQRGGPCLQKIGLLQRHAPHVRPQAKPSG